jgi:hypothetical protein
MRLAQRRSRTIASDRRSNVDALRARYHFHLALVPSLASLQASMFALMQTSSFASTEDKAVTFDWLRLPADSEVQPGLSI